MFQTQGVGYAIQFYFFFKANILNYVQSKVFELFKIAQDTGYKLEKKNLPQYAMSPKVAQCVVCMRKDDQVSTLIRSQKILMGILSNIDIFKSKQTFTL